MERQWHLSLDKGRMWPFTIEYETGCGVLQLLLPNEAIILESTFVENPIMEGTCILPNAFSASVDRVI